MIESIEISHFRGVREGKLDGLVPLVVLVGPNGCGKSTVLEALYIGASLTADTVGKCVARRKELWGGARWLFFKAGLEGGATITLKNDGAAQQIRLDLEQPKQHPELRYPAIEGGPPYLVVRLSHATGQVGLTPEDAGGLIVFASNNTFHLAGSWAAGPTMDTKLVEARSDSTQRPLHSVYSLVVEQGRREEVEGLLRDLIPGLVRLEILTSGDTPVIHVVFKDRSIPVAIAGDGIHVLVRQCLELASLPKGLVLIEEPEAFKHPAAIVQTARAVLGAVRRGIQIVLSTHSLEFIDALLAECKQADLEQLCVYRLLLQADKLLSSRIPGADVAFRRLEIVEDLR